jgi:two-component system, chemotaxis family, chemotaxis protein CheY
MKILIIDDSNLSRNIFKRSLGDDYTYLEAQDGITGIETFYLERPDLVILDLTMPGMHGMDVLTQLKNIDPHVRVIVGTADVQDYSRHQAGELGAVGYILKPFKPDDIKKVVEAALNQGEENAD